MTETLSSVAQQDCAIAQLGIQSVNYGVDEDVNELSRQNVSLGGMVDQTILSGGLFYEPTPVSSAAASRIVTFGANPGSVKIFSSGKEVSNQPVVSNSTFQAGGNDSVIVYDGGISWNNTLASGGSMRVSSGGLDSGTTMMAGAWMYIAAGGTADSTTMNGGLIHVDSGGSAARPTLNSGANIILSSGGKITDAVINKGGVITVNPNGFISGVSAVSGGRLVISSGSAYAVSMENKGSADVRSFGLASDVVLNNLGLIRVSSTGSAMGLKINPGGVAYLDKGGVILTPILSGGSLIVDSGAVLSGGSVLSGGFVSVTSGGSALDLKMTDFGIVMACSDVVAGTDKATKITGTNPGGAFYLSNGVVSGFWLRHSRSLEIRSGGTALGTIISSFTADDGTASGGKLKVFDGVASSTKMDGGFLMISGGNAVSTLISNGAHVHVEVGGTACDTTVTNNGILYISSTGSASRTTLTLNGQLYVSFGGSSYDTIVKDGVAGYYGGNAVSTTISSGGYMEVSLEGYNETFTSAIVSDTVIYSGGTAYFKQGTMHTGKLTLYSGCVFQMWDAFLDMNISVMAPGGTAPIINDLTLANCNTNTQFTITISDTQAEGVYSLAGGSHNTQRLFTVKNQAGTSLGSLTVNEYIKVGSQYYSLLEKNSTLTLSVSKTTPSIDGVVKVFSSGTFVLAQHIVSGMTFKAGGNDSAFATDDGISLNNILSSGGRMFLSSGGLDSGSILYAGGRMDVSSGGIASRTVVSTGLMFVFDGGVAKDAVLSSGCDILVYSGGLLSGGSFVPGGRADIYAGGSGFGNFVSGGRYLISSGGQTTSDTIYAGGSQEIKAGGITNGTTAVDGGRIMVYLGGEAENVRLVSSGYLWMSGGAANGVTAEANTKLFLFGGSLMSGKIRMASGITFGMDGISTLDFSLYQFTPASGSLVDNFTYFTSKFDYTLTVADLQTTGTYILAAQASAFNGSLTVKTESGASLGTLSVGGSIRTADDYTYALSMNSDKLTLSVRQGTVPAPSNLVVSASKVSWDPVPSADGYVVEYSKDGFANAVVLHTDTAALDVFNVPNGSYQIRVRASNSDQYSESAALTITGNNAYQNCVSTQNGSGDAFFIKSLSQWESKYRAQHLGSLNTSWGGLKLYASLDGKNRFGDVFAGSADKNVLCMTDDVNGDALFVDDIYTALPGSISAQQARMANLHEIRCGAGDDVLDMTSQRFLYMGGGLTIRGGSGNDVIWANSGENELYGDAGDDMLAGGADADVLAGGIGNDTLYGCGGADVFTFCENWGSDIVSQLSGEGNTVTLWFCDAVNSSLLTSQDVGGNAVFTYGGDQITVLNRAAADVSLKFGDDSSARYAELVNSGAFAAQSTEKVWSPVLSGAIA